MTVDFPSEEQTQAALQLLRSKYAGTGYEVRLAGDEWRFGRGLLGRTLGWLNQSLCRRSVRRIAPNRL